MPGGVYTTRFFGGSAQRAATGVVVPAGRRWVVRDIVAEAPAADHLEVYVAGHGYIAVVQLSAVGSVFYGHWEGRQVVKAGETLTISTGLASASAMVTGYDFAV